MPFWNNERLSPSQIIILGYFLLSLYLRLRHRHDLNGRQCECQKALHRVQLCRELSVENPPQLVKILFAHDRAIRMCNRFDVGEEGRAACAQGRGDEDVGVNAYLHSPTPSLRISRIRAFTSSSLVSPARAASPAMSCWSICIA